MSMDWHQLETKEALEVQQSDPRIGLTSVEAASRLVKTGPNELVERGGKNPVANPLGATHRGNGIDPHSRGGRSGHTG